MVSLVGGKGVAYSVYNMLYSVYNVIAYIEWLHYDTSQDLVYISKDDSAHCTHSSTARQEMISHTSWCGIIKGVSPTSSLYAYTVSCVSVYSVYWGGKCV